MKKHLRKLCAILAAVMLAVSLNITAFAAAEAECPKLGCGLDCQVERTPATCTETGSVYYICPDHGKIRVSVIPISHNYRDVEGSYVAPTCLHEGTIDQKCADCGVEKTVSLYDALGHDLVHVAAKQPAGDADGNLEYWKCSRCDTVFLDADGKTPSSMEDVTLAAHKHTLKVTPAKEPTETTPGNIRFYTCTECGKYFADEAGTVETTLADVVLPRLNHDLRHVPAKAATENAPGNISYYECALGCGKLFEDEDAAKEISLEDTIIPALGHSLNHVAGKAATDEEDGILEHWKCSGCGRLFSDKNGKDEIQDVRIPALGHDLERIQGIEATEDAPGNIPYWRCARCGKLFSDSAGKNEISPDDAVIPPKGHAHDLTLVPGKPATDEEDGVLEHWKCSRCGRLFSDKDGMDEIQDARIPAFGHELERIEGKEATENAPGNIPHWKCARCGKLFSDSAGKNEISAEDAIIPAKNHEHTLERVPGIAPTDEEAGVLEHWKCSSCGKLFADKDGRQETDDVVFPALGHDLQYVERTEPTQTHPGNLAHWKCARCGKCFADKDGTNELDPSSLILEPLGHMHSLTLTPRKDPTETEPGIKEHYVCEGCGKLFEDKDAAKELTLEQTIQEPLGHSLTEVPGKEPTETEAGVRRHWKCAQCGKIFADSEGRQELSDSDISLAPLGHDLVRREGYEPTEDKPGRITYWECARCGKLFSDPDGKEEIRLEDTILEAAHTHDWNEEVKDPACTQPGWTKLICTGCGEIREESEIPELGHELSVIPAKEPTQTETGNIAYWKCDNCGELFADEDGKVVLQPEDVVLSKLPQADPSPSQTSSSSVSTPNASTGSSSAAPDYQIPATDDETNLAMYVWLCVISGSAAVVLILLLKKQKKRKNRQ